MVGFREEVSRIKIRAKNNVALVTFCVNVGCDVKYHSSCGTRQLLVFLEIVQMGCWYRSSTQK